MSAPAPREAENWFDDAFVADWLVRQEGRAAERRRQYAMVRALVPHSVDEPFSYLNLAGGDGSLDEVLMARFPKAHATLVDGSSYMLERARERLSAYAGRLRLVQVDLGAPSWTAVGGPFDLGVSTIALHNLEDPARMRLLYREIGSIMADGGFFMNLDYVRAPHPALGDFYRHASADDDSGFLRVRGYRDFVGTVDEHLGWLVEAGFAPVDCFWRDLRLALMGGFKGRVRLPAAP